MKKLSLSLFLLFLFSFSLSFAQDSAYLPVDYPKSYTAQLNLVYGNDAEWNRLDVYYPKDSSKKVPLIINIHGGAWAHGVKESQRGYNSFFKAGWTVANIEYRMAGTDAAPAAIEDTRCALIYLIKNADKFNIDVNKVIIMGGSAGGHLALMGGLLGNDHRFDSKCDKNVDVKVMAIIDKYGITDLNSIVNLRKSKSVKTWLKDNIDNKDFLASISPINYVTKNSPPVFIVHGDADPTVEYQQSIDLKKKLDDAGVMNEFITVPGGQHGKFPPDQERTVKEAMLKFFEKLGL